jgi:multidrug resistance efflux pump
LTRLRNDGLVPDDLYEQVGKELAIREGELRANIEELRLLEKGTRPERITAARAEVRRLETKAFDIEHRIGALELNSPIAGVVVTPDLESRIGESVPAGGLLLEISEASRLQTEVLVPEREIGVVEPGLQVTVRLAAFPDRKFPGHIEEIAPIAETDDLGGAVFRVTCSLADDGHVLRPGMTGSAKITCGSYTVGRIALRRVLRLIDPSLL